MFGFTGMYSVAILARKRSYMACARAQRRCPTRFDASYTTIDKAEKRVEKS
jgi:hypothetical protein